MSNALQNTGGSTLKALTGGGYGSVASAVGPITFLEDISFDGLSNGAPITSLVTFWGTQGNGYGCAGDTAVKMAGKTSSVNLSIEAGTTGRPGDGSPAGNGDFGWATELELANQVADGEELWIGEWVYFPATFDFRTDNNTGLKFLRYSNSTTGRKIDWLIHQAAGEAVQDGYNILNEEYTAPIVTLRETNSLFNLGEWNFVCQYVKASSLTTDSVQRIWVNDQFVMEFKGTSLTEVASRWIDPSGDEQTAVNVVVSGSWATLASSGSKIVRTLQSTYWNGGPSIDQSYNIQRVVWEKDDTLLATDSDGNKYIASTQVA